MEKVLNIGESFQVQFVWQIPDGDYLRAIFAAEILNRDNSSDKYLLRLTEFLAGRQETAEGEMRPVEEVTQEYWSLVDQITGRIVVLAYEAADGRPLHLRLATLTGEHNFFYRFNPQSQPDHQSATHHSTNQPINQ
jgi:hypothetical protein